jgi:hypothetical protein
MRQSVWMSFTKKQLANSMVRVLYLVECLGFPCFSPTLWRIDFKCTPLFLLNSCLSLMYDSLKKCAYLWFHYTWVPFTACSSLYLPKHNPTPGPEF